MKKTLLLTLILCCALLMTGCACKHEQTEIRDNIAPTCTIDGYTGDTYCLECEEKVADGEAIPAPGHTEGALTGAADPTCTEDGYTGDIPCTVCSEILTPGEVIPATGHTEAPITNDFASSCTVDGYTGDVRCAVCEDILTWGEAIPAAGHIEGEPTDVIEPTCTTDGYTGDVYCTVCGERLVTGEAIPAAGHVPGDPVNAIEPTCTTDGYTGDVYCTVCGERLVTGEAIPAAGHVPGDPVNAIEPTCKSAGYTGDTPCTVCGEVLPGEQLPIGDHRYVDNICPDCGWRTAGLYIDDELAMSWDELVNSGFITLYGETNMTDIADNLYGTLVVKEGITHCGSYRMDAFNSTKLNCVYLPKSFTFIPSFMYCSDLEHVYFYGTGTWVEGYSFQGCTSLKSISLPEGVTLIKSNAFADCTALEEVVLPSTLEHIYSEAFLNCSSLKSINLPDSIEGLGDHYLSGTAITELIMPAKISDIGPIRNCPNLTIIDFSKSTKKNLHCGIGCPPLVANCPALTTLILPPTLENIYSAPVGKNVAVTQLDLPDSVKVIESNAAYDLEKAASITSIIWPVSLVDAGPLAKLPNVATIYYCGSELQWSLSGGAALFPNAEVIFDYVR